MFLNPLSNPKGEAMKTALPIGRKREATTINYYDKHGIHYPITHLGTAPILLDPQTGEVIVSITLGLMAEEKIKAARLYNRCDAKMRKDQMNAHKRHAKRTTQEAKAKNAQTLADYYSSHDEPISPFHVLPLESSPDALAENMRAFLARFGSNTESVEPRQPQRQDKTQGSTNPLAKFLKPTPDTDR
jgi:hypothetical protein